MYIHVVQISFRKTRQTSYGSFLEKSLEKSPQTSRLLSKGYMYPRKITPSQHFGQLHTKQFTVGCYCHGTHYTRYHQCILMVFWSQRRMWCIMVVLWSPFMSQSRHQCILQLATPNCSIQINRSIVTSAWFQSTDPGTAAQRTINCSGTHDTTPFGYCAICSSNVFEPFNNAQYTALEHMIQQPFG